MSAEKNSSNSPLLALPKTGASEPEPPLRRFTPKEVCRFLQAVLKSDINPWVAFDTLLSVVGCAIALVFLLPFILLLKLTGRGKRGSNV
ncbi:MAG: hypothetical protein LAN36_11450 [Acidobacteriia bacterium]|nr:hypothetical protein [Terriglobia bacterium]